MAPRPYLQTAQPGIERFAALLPRVAEGLSQQAREQLDADLVAKVVQTKPGTTVPLQVYRSKRAQTVNVTIEELNLDEELGIRAGRTPQVLEPDLARAQELFEWADHLAVFTPLWWGSVPALLKGFGSSERPRITSADVRQRLKTATASLATAVGATISELGSELRDIDTSPEEEE